MKAIKGKEMKYLHVSKTLTTRNYQTIVSPGIGITYTSQNTHETNARKERRCGETTSRQQRKAIKAWRAEQKYESKLNAEIAAHESLLDWQEDEAENMASERERRADELYEEHFS